jgi:hypothetical protein
VNELPPADQERFIDMQNGRRREFEIKPRGFTLRSLAPQYLHEEHEIPFSALVDALKSDLPTAERPINIALAGPYGSGKSSILNKIEAKWPTRTARVSLSALTPPKKGHRHSFGNLTTNNFLQKEIVKQLLYRESPINMPDSRFQRIEPPSIDRAWGVACFVAVMALLFTVLNDFPSQLAATGFDGNLSAGWLASCLVILVISYTAGWTFHQIRRRHDLRGLSAGGASVTLADRSASYFDEYFDEILYFFQQTRVDILILEDLDRFDSIEIYEALRGLSGLLNNSKHLGRKIQFVYAVRDSIFAYDAIKRSPDTAHQQLTDRTKFFELIVPLVPFITHRNAADLLKRSVSELPIVPEDRVLEAVAPHVPDMRLLTNIINEYYVFASQLLDSQKRLGGLNAESLFAMVAYKNVAPGEFEKIRYRESELDTFADALRRGINATIDANKIEISRLTGHIHGRRITNAEAERLVHRADRVFGVLHQSQFNEEGRLLSFSSEGAEKTWNKYDLSNPDSWSEINSVDDLTINFSSQRSLTISDRGIMLLLDGRQNLRPLEDASAEAFQGTIADLEQQNIVLRRGNFQELLSSSKIKLVMDGERETVSALAERTLRTGTPLVMDLMRTGNLDRHYALYTAKYYEETLTANAMTFLTQNVEPNISDPYFTFKSGQEIEALIQRHGAEIFIDNAGQNLQLVDHLCLTQNPLLDSLCNAIALGGEQERNFVELVLEESQYRSYFYEQLSMHYDGSLNVLMRAKGLNGAHSIELFNAYLRAAIAVQDIEHSEAEVLDLLRKSVMSLPLLQQPVESGRADLIARQLARLGMVVTSLDDVHESFAPALISRAAWTLNARNLAFIGKTSKIIALDALRDVNAVAYSQVVDRVDEYAHLVRAEGVDSVLDAARLESLFSDMRWVDPEKVAIFLSTLPSTMTVSDIDRVPRGLWAVIMNRGTISMNGENISKYLKLNGPTLDDSIVAALRQRGLAATEELTEDVAMAIINDHALGVDEKLDLATQSVSSHYNPDLVQEPGRELLGPLLGIWFEDDVALFAAALTFGDATTIDVVSRSLAFRVYCDVYLYEDHTVLAILQAETVGEENKFALAVSVLNRPEISTLLALAICDIYEHGFQPLDFTHLRLLGISGVPRHRVINLLGQNAQEYTIGDIRLMLSDFNDEYKELTHPGPGLHFKRSDGLKALLVHLRDSGQHVARIRDVNGMLTVTRR